MLEVKDISTYYGDARALFGVSLSIQQGEVVTLLGRNGMGKTTTIHSIMGITPASTGNIHFRGHDTRTQPSYRISQLGIGLVPEGRQIFPNLTVRENLLATARAQSTTRVPISANTGATTSTNRWTYERVVQLFPVLHERASFMGNLLSGGEQQMLAVARALLTNPDLLLLDDATEGLAPMIRLQIWESLAALKAEGISMLVVDKNLKDLLPLADRHYVLESGHVVWSGSSAELQAKPELQSQYLGV